MSEHGVTCMNTCYNESYKVIYWFLPMLLFNTPWNHYKSKGFLISSWHLRIYWRFHEVLNQNIVQNWIRLQAWQLYLCQVLHPNWFCPEKACWLRIADCQAFTTQSCNFAFSCNKKILNCVLKSKFSEFFFLTIVTRNNIIWKCGP